MKACPHCRGLLYDSSDSASALERSASISCLMCGRVWFRRPPPSPIPPARPRGRPRLPQEVSV